MEKYKVHGWVGSSKYVAIIVVQPLFSPMTFVRHASLVGTFVTNTVTSHHYSSYESVQDHTVTILQISCCFWLSSLSTVFYERSLNLFLTALALCLLWLQDERSGGVVRSHRAAEQV
jgi:hypothetical protein